jgi:hypothetical protein
MMQSICSSEMPDLTRATRRHIIEDGTLPIHRRENLKCMLEFHEFVCLIPIAKLHYRQPLATLNRSAIA